MNSTNLNILLADDDTDDCIFFEQAIESLKPTPHLKTVNDGEHLMNYLYENLTNLPTVLFLDINMPRKNGFECLAEIKRDANLKHLPVIMFSTSFEQDVVNQLYQNGAHYFIRKPSEFLQFKKIIQQALIKLGQIIQKNNSTLISQPSFDNFVLVMETESQIGIV